MREIPEQTRRSGAAAVPRKDRRAQARQRVVSLTYVDLGENNGGIVLNVSETGVGIQAVEMVRECVGVRLQLPTSKKPLDVRAEIAWLGSSRKEVGLRFVDLSEDALKKIQNWIACEASPYAFSRHNGNYFFEPTPVEMPTVVALASIAQPDLATKFERAPLTFEASREDPAAQLGTALEASPQIETQIDAEVSNALLEPGEIEDIPTAGVESPTVDTATHLREFTNPQDIGATSIEPLAAHDVVEIPTPQEISDEGIVELSEVSSAVIQESLQIGTEATAIHSAAAASELSDIQETESDNTEVHAAEPEAHIPNLPESQNPEATSGEALTSKIEIEAAAPIILDAQVEELTLAELLLSSESGSLAIPELKLEERAQTEVPAIHAEANPELPLCQNAASEQAEITVDTEGRPQDFLKLRTLESESVQAEAPVPAATKQPEFQSPANARINEPHSATGASRPGSASTALRDFPIAAETPLFVKPHILSPMPEDGWKSFRVQTHGGWFVASILVLATAISFVAGMALRRGTLDELTPPPTLPVQTVPTQSSNQNAATQPATPVAAASSDTASIAAEAPAKSLDIEIVDTSGRRWTIPSILGSTRPTPANISTSAAQLTPASQSSLEPPKISQAPPSTPASITSPTSASPNMQSATAPLIVPLPETPISATGSVAIRTRGSIIVPPGIAPPSPDGRNLRTGQLTDVVEPYYPPEAQQLHIEGAVKLHAIIAADGSVQSVEPLSGPDLLVQSAIAAVRQWKYTPTTLNAKPVTTQEEISFIFRLPN